mgnify:CR=1 FL=1
MKQAYKLRNYLKKYRLQCGLTQKEIAYLLGCSDATAISHYERNVRIPPLEILLGYEKIFNLPMRFFYARTASEIGRKIEKRSGILLNKIVRQPSSKMNERKIDFLQGRCEFSPVFKVNPQS